VDPDRCTSIQIWSPDFTGHHFLYAKLVAEFAAEHRIPVSVALTEQGLQSKEFQLHLADLGVLTTIAHSLQSALSALPQHGLLVICHVDRIMTELLKSRVPEHARVVALVMRPSRTMPSKPKSLAKALLTAALHARRRIRVSELSTIGDPPTRVLLQVPDPLVSTTTLRSEDEARSRLKLPIAHDCRLGLVIGLLSPRKRPDLLIGALAYLPDQHHLLFAGHQDESFERVVASGIRRFPGRIHTRNEHLTDEDFALCISASTYVAALHQTAISSGVVLQAIALQRPVLVNAGTRLAETVVERGLGAAALPTPETVAAAIELVAKGDLSPDPIKLPTASDFVSSLLGLA
jgi:glycosyltransferase involved in cell wall biosynthesis